MRKEEDVGVLQALVNVLVLHQLLVNKLLVGNFLLVLGIDSAGHEFGRLGNHLWYNDLKVLNYFLQHGCSLHG